MAEKTNVPSYKKARYFAKNYKAKRYLEPGQSGFLVTCNFREKDCIREAYNILNRYADELYGLPSSAIEKPEDENDENKADISTQLVNQIEMAKTEATPQGRKRFQAVDTGASNCLFISTTIEKPSELGMAIIRDIASTKKQETRFLIRLIPIEKVCKANITDIVNTAGELMDHHFIKEPKTFSIVFNRRYNNSLNRDDVIKELADLVGQKNPLNKADLKQAELCVIVEVIKGLCLISIVPDYFKLKKYNLLELSENSTATSTVVEPDSREETLLQP